MNKLFKVIIFLVCLVTITQQISNFSKTKNIFEKRINVTNGDVMQCEITKVEIYEPKNSLHVFTSVSLSNNAGTYSFHPIENDTKCISFDVRTKFYAHIAISDLPIQQNSTSSSWLETVLHYSNIVGPNAISVIRTEYKKEVIIENTPNIISENELRGFWIRWSDDQLLEVGRESENIPFMSYRNPTKLSIKYIGIGSHISPGEWILYGDSKCPQANEIKKTIKTESDCFILSEDPK